MHDLQIEFTASSFMNCFVELMISETAFV